MNNIFAKYIYKIKEALLLLKSDNQPPYKENKAQAIVAEHAGWNGVERRSNIPRRKKAIGGRRKTDNPRNNSGEGE